MVEEQKEEEELLEVPINVWRQQADFRTIRELFWSRFIAHFIIQKLCGCFKFFLKKKRHVHRVHRFTGAIDISLFLFYCQKLILTEPASSFRLALLFLLVEQLKTQSNTHPEHCCNRTHPACPTACAWFFLPSGSRDQLGGPGLGSPFLPCHRACRHLRLTVSPQCHGRMPVLHTIALLFLLQ